MNRFVPREKQSKRAKRDQDSAKRTTWGAVNPVTRKTDNKKVYDRKRSPRWYDDDSTGIIASLAQTRSLTVSLNLNAS